MSQESLYARIYRKKAGKQLEPPDQAPALTPTARTLQCGHTVWGIRKISYQIVVHTHIDIYIDRYVDVDQNFWCPGSHIKLAIMA